MAEPLLIVFAKAPIAGFAKRRLIPLLGADGAAELHAWLLSRLLRRLSGMHGVRVELHCAPDCSHPLFVELATREGITLHNQWGSDLGARMANALRRGVREGGRAVLIGSDLPDLEGVVIEHAFDALAQGREALFSPTQDGGYGLIGLKRFDPTLFERIDWGTEWVMAQTRERLHASGLVWGELRPRLADLDRPQDLLDWLGREPQLRCQLPVGVAASIRRYYQQDIDQQEQ